ncbi:hypothetical protein FJSC11DRAFT_4311 [Fischerella thermalis JSC-11]|jgi:hypothetical protein|uniref:Uncharacterized protein n=1 Tax=Fischerella thermalis JSC-11 TaxID=741277 RepID=G6FZL2_9CYAN|nr:hypothetical protein FJSC11DRAFT_4311 [Fischerella thermalis JSC-11]
MNTDKKYVFYLCSSVCISGYTILLPLRLAKKLHPEKCDINYKISIFFQKKASLDIYIRFDKDFVEP